MNFGTTHDGAKIELFALKNGSITANVITYGAILAELHVPDRRGKAEDVVLGFDNLADYLAKNGPYFGATVGRFANRIAGGDFSLGGRKYSLVRNNGPNSLHGGIRGFDKVVWKVEAADEKSVQLSYFSRDGEEGYPGNLSVRVSFTVTDDSALRIDYTAATDGDTPINLTNHTYFHLGGPSSGTILDHEVQLEADAYTPVDETLIPTGRVVPVRGTPLDFTSSTPIGARLQEVGGNPIGYDHNYVIRDGGKSLALAASVYEPRSGRVMKVHTTQPGVQLYTANFLDGTITGKGGDVYRQHGGFCLETQHFPDSVNQPNFPSCILRPGENFSQTTIYQFSAR